MLLALEWEGVDGWRRLVWVCSEFVELLKDFGETWPYWDEVSQAVQTEGADADVVVHQELQLPHIQFLGYNDVQKYR
jgi:hypothetical protein